MYIRKHARRLCLLVLWGTFSITMPANNNTFISIPPFLRKVDDSEIRKKVSELSLDQKIGQLFMPALILNQNIRSLLRGYRTNIEHIKDIITKYHIGGIIFLGSNTIEQQIEATKQLQSISNIPLLIGQDLEPGEMLKSRLPEADAFPNANELGMMDDESVYKTGYAIGKLCQQLGVHVNFAPVADINSNPKNPIINTRSFGKEKKVVAKKAAQFMQGLQDAGILSCGKHFPGHGDTSKDSHHELPVVEKSREELDACEMYPFDYLITQGISMIMIGHLAMNGIDSASSTNVPASLSRYVTTDILRRDLCFQGLAITDALDMKGVTQFCGPGQRELEALKAGNDILLCSSCIPHAIATIKSAIHDGTFSIEEIDRRVYKILCAKEWAKKMHTNTATAKN